MPQMIKEAIDKLLFKHDRLSTSREFKKLDMPYFRFCYEKFHSKFLSRVVDKVLKYFI